MEDRDLIPGTVVLGKYRVEEELGAGGMGRVLRASHLYLQQSVAIKILLPEMTASPSTVARFLREAQAAVRLKSEHTARVIDVGTLPEGTPFMIMEYLEGNDLNQILRHHGPQLPAIVCDLMLQACEGLAEAHAIGIVHRDIKPSNFFITRRPDGTMLLKILDFGISKTPVNYSDDLTGTHSVIGTPSYMAPEQMKSGKQADARSDIWSMGIVMYQLLCGRPPFSAESYAELVLQVANEPPTPVHTPLPTGLHEVILRCLEKQPSYRQQNVGELARMLAPFASDPITAAQTATRATRILQARANQSSVDRGALPGQQSLPISAGGGLATPIPLSPAQLTPRSWPPSTSLSQGRGQMTHRVSGSKGWLIAGALSLTILAGAGGYIASAMIKDGGSSSSETTTSTAPTTGTAPAAAASTATAPTSGTASTGTAPTATAPTTGTASTTIAPTTGTASTAAASTTTAPATGTVSTVTKSTGAKVTSAKASTTTAASKTETKSTSAKSTSAKVTSAKASTTTAASKTETKSSTASKSSTKSTPPTSSSTKSSSSKSSGTKSSGTKSSGTKSSGAKSGSKSSDPFNSRY